MTSDPVYQRKLPGPSWHNQSSWSLELEQWKTEPVSEKSWKLQSRQEDHVQTKKWAKKQDWRRCRDEAEMPWEGGLKAPQSQKEQSRDLLKFSSLEAQRYPEPCRFPQSSLQPLMISLCLGQPELISFHSLQLKGHWWEQSRRVHSKCQYWTFLDGGSYFIPKVYHNF